MNQEDFELVDALIARRTAARPHSSPQGSPIVPIICCIIFVVAGLLIAPRFYTWWWGLDTQPQTTINTPPTVPPRPTRAALAPAQDAPAVPAAAPVIVVIPAEPTEAPAWVSGGGAQLSPAAPDIPTPAPAWHAPMAAGYDVCKDWHVPLPWPAECGAQGEGWHAPMRAP
jgi:hypothetical protein